ncbi:unnamed protein product [Vicia faba]|uniref:Uncharacterized protein n=1 Tax=Vicia faba TaxID=3906 RepID=A0AAV1A868_VICFA|nr:unnamed protein product [Vicia faba]
MNKKFKIPFKNFVAPKKKTESLMKDHMSQGPAQHAAVTDSYGVKMLGVDIRKKETSNKIWVYDFNDNDDEPIMFLNPKPLLMVFPVDISTKRTKSIATKKKLLSVKEPFEEPYVESHANSHVEPNVESSVPTSGEP